MMQYKTFVFEGKRGTVTKDGFVQWATLSCEKGCLIGELRDMVEATLARFFVVQ